MNLGYLFLLMALVGYSMLGIFHKMADYKNCRPRPITLLLFFWGGLWTSLYVWLASSPYGVPRQVFLIAVIFGTFACFAILSFQAGLKYGKIATSWLLINLSMVIPTVLSILIYAEPVTAAKAVSVVLIFAAMFLLWRDKQVEGALQELPEGTEKSSKEDAPASGKGTRTRTWLKLMLIAFTMNGLAAFGLRILVGEGAGSFVMQYIALWYWAGFLVMSASYLRLPARPYRREVYVSAVMGICSVTGTVGLASALDQGVPGFIVYPVSIGGGLFIVVSAGVLLFRERVTSSGILGILTGIGALVVLALS